MEIEEKQKERAFKMESAKSKLAEKYQNKVQSKLLVETKAMQEKKRAKFNPDTDDRVDGMTMGGKLPMQSMRAAASLRGRYWLLTN